MLYPFVNIEGGQYIAIGSNVQIFKNCRLQALTINTNNPSILIGNLIRIWSNSQISCANSITIEDGCALGANSFITDVTHDYESIDVCQYESKLKVLAPVIIGSGTWVGRNAIIMGCKIGKHCVIGSNAFVTRDIPDYCVVVGSPARIIKRYNVDSKQWERTDKDGNFLTKE